jgi:hypothetical protein
MFGQLLSDDIAISADAPTGAGTTTIDSTPVDMSGFSGVLFIARVGTPAANNNIRAQQDTVVGMGTAADLAGTLVASGALNIVALEVLSPNEQFVRCRVTRGTSTTIDSLITIRFGARQRPVAVPATVAFESWISTAEGSA